MIWFSIGFQNYFDASIKEKREMYKKARKLETEIRSLLRDLDVEISVEAFSDGTFAGFTIDCSDEVAGEVERRLVKHLKLKPIKCGWIKYQNEQYTLAIQHYSFRLRGGAEVTAPFNPFLP